MNRIKLRDDIDLNSVLEGFKDNGDFFELKWGKLYLNPKIKQAHNSQRLISLAFFKSF